MEHPYNLETNAANNFYLNGQQHSFAGSSDTSSNSSSAAVSYNGTPSHSFKGNVSTTSTDISPISDVYSSSTQFEAKLIKSNLANGPIVDSNMQRINAINHQIFDSRNYNNNTIRSNNSSTNLPNADAHNLISKSTDNFIQNSIPLNNNSQSRNNYSSFENNNLFPNTKSNIAASQSMQNCGQNLASNINDRAPTRLENSHTVVNNSLPNAIMNVSSTQLTKPVTVTESQFPKYNYFSTPSQSSDFGMQPVVDARYPKPSGQSVQNFSNAAANVVPSSMLPTVVRNTSSSASDFFKVQNSQPASSIINTSNINHRTQSVRQIPNPVQTAPHSQNKPYTTSIQNTAHSVANTVSSVISPFNYTGQQFSTAINDASQTQISTFNQKQLIEQQKTYNSTTQSIVTSQPMLTQNSFRNNQNYQSLPRSVPSINHNIPNLNTYSSAPQMRNIQNSNFPPQQIRNEIANPQIQNTSLATQPSYQTQEPQNYSFSAQSQKYPQTSYKQAVNNQLPPSQSHMQMNSYPPGLLQQNQYHPSLIPQQNQSLLQQNQSFQSVSQQNRTFQTSQQNRTFQTSQQNQTFQTPHQNHTYPLPQQNTNYKMQQQMNQIPQVNQTQHNIMAQYSNSVHSQPAPNVNMMSTQFADMSVVKQGYNTLRGMQYIDLLRCRDILPKERVHPPQICLNAELPVEATCNPEVIRCTLNKIPETKSILDKCRLPLGILLYPFCDLNKLSVIQCGTIVRCRSCRTYINPFVYFLDNRHWKCNLCFRTNELPDEFLFNPITRLHDDPSKRPEIQNATIEFIAPSEYMVRPPQPAVYLFVLDVSRIATQTGYLKVVCDLILDHLNQLPGDSRTSVGFITFDSTVHFYNLAEDLSQPQQLVVSDINDVFLPLPDDLIVNLHENLQMIKNLLVQLPKKYHESYVTQSALGSALQAAYKLLAPTGGRVTVFQTCLPNCGPGALKSREDPSQRSGDKVDNLKPATDFYKKLALECNAQHVAVDLFVLNAQYIDLATVAGISQISGGCIHNFPLFNSSNTADVDKLKNIFIRYLTRKIGFEAVMRLRCTRGLSIHSFHGNFFVRTTDLLALPNINPDAGFGMQVSIDENLSDLQTVTFQAALLYTSSKGERRIRVHTLCLPVSADHQDVLLSADQQCIIGLLSKMAVDRSIQSSISDAREAFVNAACDSLSVFKSLVSPAAQGVLLASSNMCLIPMYILALMKHVAFRTAQVTRLDDRVYAMYQMKCLPLSRLIQLIYPDLYAVHRIAQEPKMEVDGNLVPNLPLLQLTAERIESAGIYLLDDGDTLILFIGQTISPQTSLNFFGTSQYSAIPDNVVELCQIDSEENKLLHAFIEFLQSLKPYCLPLHIIKYTSPSRIRFFEKLIEDKTEAGVSYHEFLQTLRSKIN